MSDTPAQIRALYDTDPDRDAYEAIAEAVDTAITARDHLIHALTARALETGGQVAAIRAFADRHRNRPGEVSAQGMVRMLDNIVGKSDAPIVAELPRRSPIVRAANEDGSYTMSDGHRHTLRAEAPPCKHFDAHHGVAGEPGLFGCDECGRTWPTRPPLDPRTAK